MPHFFDQLAQAVALRRNAVCVGLDPRERSLPPALIRGGDSLREQAGVFRSFCQGVIDVVAPLVPVVKPQSAFFEELGPPGVAALVDVIRYAQDRGLLVILDAKRNDIGTTAHAYARGMLGRDSPWGADALTISPYLGEDSLAPFVETAGERGAGLFVLVKTSNPGGGMLQDLETTAERAGASRPRHVYDHVAQLVERLAAETLGQCGYGLVGAVCGATYPQQLAELRAAMPHSWFLIPGFGAQGAAAADVVPGFDSQGLGAVVNNSRGLIFAHARKDYSDRFTPHQWQDAIAAATQEMIGQLRG
ncbi:MAG TPA: orotidine-5'-phosphate decarboxylase [Lacipirellulaceae bacterium]|nr:orotidine-5'-phosphate decarboxylase [Lacipirellulaceae bacterium]